MNTPRILIVDDEPSFNRLLRMVLENTGRYIVKEENDATRALETARQFKPDLILLDFIMPRADGGNVAHALRGEPRFSHTPIVFLSATVAGNAASQPTIASFPAYSKPISADRLMQVIDEHLAKVGR